MKEPEGRLITIDIIASVSEYFVTQSWNDGPYNVHR